MAATKIADVLVPEVFQAYVIQKTTEQHALIDSGIVTPDARFDELAVKGGTTIHMPYWNDLDGDDEVLSDTGALTPGKITSGQDLARLQLRGRAWGVNDLATALSGDDPMGAIASLVASYWKRMEQKNLINTLAGVFGAATMSGHVLDVGVADCGVGGVSAVKINGDRVIDAMTLMGDAQSLLTAIMMHSAVYSTLQKNDLIEFRPDSEGKLEIPFYLGKRVIVDDSMPVANVTNGKKYTTYLFGQGAIARGEGSAETPVETDRDSLAGEDFLINRRHFILHPRGVKWTETACAGKAPTNAELATATNWLRVYDPKSIRIVKLVTNG